MATTAVVSDNCGLRVPACRNPQFRMVPVCRHRCRTLFGPPPSVSPKRTEPIRIAVADGICRSRMPYPRSVEAHDLRLSRTGPIRKHPGSLSDGRTETSVILSGKFAVSCFCRPDFPMSVKTGHRSGGGIPSLPCPCVLVSCP